MLKALREAKPSVVTRNAWKKHIMSTEAHRKNLMQNNRDRIGSR